MEDKLKQNRVIGIRRENKNKWERRVAIIPQDCKKLLEKGIRIIIQPSKLRCFTDKQYEDVGCEIHEDITGASLIIGVKEVPLDYLYPEKTYMYFSHTIKGQPANMPALKDILEKNIRLIDYECIKESTGSNPQRLVAFGRFAGLAGAIDFLQGIGEFLMYRKFFTPFIYTGYSYMYATLEDAKKSISNVGKLITQKHLPKEICPFVIGFTSNGRVSKGAQEIIKLLPHEFVDPDDLEDLVKNKKNARRDIVYLTIIESKHMYKKKNNLEFDKDDFYKNPDNYYSIFAEKFVPYLSILYHCMFWDIQYPRILTLDESYELSTQKRFRLLGVCDITCDLKGSIELLQKFTTIENPFYTIDPITNIIEEDFNKMSESSILYHAVDHLPAEMPIDASKHFSDKLTPFIDKIFEIEYPSNYLEKAVEINKHLPAEILNACETWNGNLMPKYVYLYEELGKYFPKYNQFVCDDKLRKRSLSKNIAPIN